MRSLTILLVLAGLPAPAWSQFTEVLTIPVPANGSFAQAALCFVPDANGDGLADILVGSPLDSSSGVNAGRLTMFSGADGSVIFDVPGPTPTKRFGIDVDVLSDITGDGVAEVIVGSACSTWPSCGGSSEVLVLDGATGAQIYSVSGTDVDFFGISIAGIPDINGDGLDDFIVAASDDNCVWLDAGKVFAYSGSDGQPINSNCSGVSFGRFGLSGIDGVGDLDGDGIGDWIAASCECPGSQNGFARVVSGATGATVLQYSVGGAAQLSTSPTAAGDINGDGVGDFYVGDQNPGRLHAVSGSTGQALWLYPHSVSAIRALPDIDGDGVPDVCGAALAGTDYYLLSGATGAVVGSITSPGFGTAGPHSMDAAGDVTGDGFAELAIVDHAGGFVRVYQVGLTDCNGNGILDSEDIANGTSSDCNTNEVPDECEIANDPNLDCDLDGVLDSCQLAANPSLDCDGNNVLDTCDIMADPALDWNGDGVLDECSSANYCTAAVNSTGVPAVIGASGTPVIIDNDFTLEAWDLPTGEFGYFLMSESTGFVQGFGGSAGNLCLGAPQIRMLDPLDGGQVLDSGATGTVSFTLDITFLPQATVLQPGDTWYFQLWFRDVFTSNTTDGIEVMFQ